MGFGSFLAGAASAGSADIEKRRDSALEIKMRSQLMEQEHQQKIGEMVKKDELDKFSSEGSARIGSLAGVNMLPKQQFGADEAKVLAGMINTNTKSDSKRLFSGRDSMSVEDFEKMSGASTGYPPDKILSPLQVSVLTKRLHDEEPSPTDKTQITQQLRGLSIIEQLKRLRKDAITEISGHTQTLGRGATLLSAVDQGDNLPAVKTYTDFKKTALPTLARLHGESGRMTEAAIERQDGASPALSVSSEATDAIFRNVEDMARNNLDVYEKSYPGYRRRVENEMAGNGLDSISGRHNPLVNQAKDALSAPFGTPEDVKTYIKNKKSPK